MSSGSTEAGSIGAFSVFLFVAGQPAQSAKAESADTLRKVLERAGITVTDEHAVFLPLDRHGHEADEADEPEFTGAALDQSLQKLGSGRGTKIVCSKCRLVEVEVHYQDKTLKHLFRPGAMVGRVLVWMVRTLGLTAENYDVIRLQLCGESEPLPNDSRLVQLLSPDSCALCMSLILKPRVQG